MEENHIEKTYKRPFNERFIRNFVSWTLSKSFNFKLISFLTLLAKPFIFLFPKRLKQMIKLMPINFPKKTMPKMEIYSPTNKKKTSCKSCFINWMCSKSYISTNK